MRVMKHSGRMTLAALAIFAVGIVAGGIRDSSASQRNPPRERYEYRVLAEQGVGASMTLSRSRGPFRPIAPPKELEELLNKFGRDGWEVENLRIREARSELKASREAPAYYLYSYSGDTGPRFLRLRRRID